MSILNNKIGNVNLTYLLEKHHKNQRKTNDKENALQDQIETLRTHLNSSNTNLSAIELSDLKQDSIITFANKILSLELIDKKTEQHLNKILLVLQDEVQSDLSEDEKKVTEWLTHLKLLNGIPLKYMVPLHQLLPNESIRFFTIDEKWIDHLINGALSIGNNQSETDIWHDSERNKTLNKKANIHLHDVHLKKVATHLLNHFPQKTRLQLLKNKFNSFDENHSSKEISGFIMRSDFVKKYAGLRIEATDANGKACPSLSSEIIGGGIKLCLFEGIINNVTFHENSDSLLYKLEETDSCKKDNSVDGVLDIVKLAKQVGAINSANLAKELLSGPEIFIFELKAN